MNDWPTKKLGEVCKVNPTKSEIKDIPDDTFVSFVPMSAVSETSQRIEEQEDRKLSDVKKGYTYFRKGDILFAKITPCMENGKVALTDNLKNKIGFASTEFHVIRAGGEILPDYIFHLIASKKFRDEAKTKMTGSAGQKRVPKSFLENYTIPLPPLSQQKKIVARLEGLLGKIKEVKRLRAEAQEAAQNLLPAELHRIFTQPTTPHKQHTNKLENVGMSGKPASVKNYGEAQWEEKELGEVVNIEAKKNTKSLPYVGMEDIESGTGKFIGSKEKRAVRSTTSYFTPDHVLYGKLRPYLNKFLVPDFEGHCTTEFLPLRPDTRFLTREWLAVWLRHNETVDNIMATTTGSRMPRANMNLVKKFKIPLPPVAEQKKIVARMDSLSEKIKNLREYQKSTASDFTSLEQSILSKAFNSNLM